jgi:hypothetical protein
MPVSLTSPIPAPTQGETAVADLLRIVRAPRFADTRLAQTALRETGQLGRGRSFLADSLPRDRRGRVAQKQRATLAAPKRQLEMPEEDESGEDTPRIPMGGLADLERERERAMLESLRSPEPDTATTARASGGWGLGGGHEENGKVTEEDEELNWDQAQVGLLFLLDRFLIP